MKHVYGFEVVAQAVSDARQNAKLNCIDNATFIEGDLKKIDLNFASNLPKPDIVITCSFFMDNLFHLTLLLYLVSWSSSLGWFSTHVPFERKDSNGFVG